jgi:hypothetical protein
MLVKGGDCEGEMCVGSRVHDILMYIWTLAHSCIWYVRGLDTCYSLQS